jgi:xanthine phosphoribosyltransferase
VEYSIALKEIIDKAGANLVGVGIVIEKGFQNGREKLYQNGIKRIESLAVIKSMENNSIVFD